MSFQEELFGCFSDMASCIWACCIPCGVICLQAKAVDMITGDGMVIPCLLTMCLSCIGGAINRGTIRTKLGIQGSFVSDCLLWWCCGPCAGCQEYREAKKRGN